MVIVRWAGSSNGSAVLSAIHADEWVPVEPGGDAALGLAICQVLIEKGLIDTAFVKEQTDLPLLVRLDTQKFLRASDLDPKGREDQCCYWDPASNKAVLAPLDTLKLPVDPALEGTFQVTLANGQSVQVRPVFSLLKDLLNREYTPEQASKQCGTHPDTIRRLADMCAKAKGHIQVMVGWNSCKYYHGDLIERVMCLILALTGGATVQACREVLARFTGLPHRLEWVARLDGVDYYDDSKGTNVGAVVRALEHFARPVVLIAGGRDKGGEYAPLLPLLRQKVRQVVLVGEAKEIMAAAFWGVVPLAMADDMAAAVRLAAAAARPGDVVLLSPACSSFDMFRDYAHRGRVFQEAVKEMSHGRARSQSSRVGV